MWPKNLDSVPCCSPGASTIATTAFSLKAHANENLKVIQNPGFLRDHPQNWNTDSFCHAWHTLKISERSVHNFLSYLANTQTDRQTDKVWQKHYLLGGGNKSIHQTYRFPAATLTGQTFCYRQRLVIRRPTSEQTSRSHTHGPTLAIRANTQEL